MPLIAIFFFSLLLSVINSSVQLCESILNSFESKSIQQYGFRMKIEEYFEYADSSTVIFRCNNSRQSRKTGKSSIPMDYRMSYMESPIDDVLPNSQVYHEINAMNVSVYRYISRNIVHLFGAFGIVISVSTAVFTLFLLLTFPIR